MTDLASSAQKPLVLVSSFRYLRVRKAIRAGVDRAGFQHLDQDAYVEHLPIQAVILDAKQPTPDITALLVGSPMLVLSAERGEKYDDEAVEVLDTTGRPIGLCSFSEELTSYVEDWLREIPSRRLESALRRSIERLIFDLDGLISLVDVLIKADHALRARLDGVKAEIAQLRLIQAALEEELRKLQGADKRTSKLLAGAAAVSLAFIGGLVGGAAEGVAGQVLADRAVTQHPPGQDQIDLALERAEASCSIVIELSD